MGGNRHQVDVVLVHVDWNLANRLHAVGVEEHAALATDLANFPPRLQDADFIVCGHDRDQDRLVVDRALQIFQIHQTIFLHRQISHAVAILLKPLAGVEHRLVFGHGGDDVVAFLAVHLGDALDRQVVALRRTRGKDDLLRGRADQFGDLLASLFHGFFRCPSKGMVPARGVAELFHEIGQHGLEHTRIHGGGGMVVHVDGQLDAVGSLGALLQGRCLYIGTHGCCLLPRSKSWVPTIRLA